MIDEPVFEFTEMLEAMKNIDPQPDYKTIVLKDWEGIHDSLKNILRDGVKNDAVPGLAERYKDPTELEYALAIVVDGRKPLTTEIEKALDETLQKFPGEIITEVMKVVFRVDVKRLWDQSSFSGKSRIEIAKKKKAELGNTRQRLCGILSSLENHMMKCVCKREYPEIILSPLENSIRSLTHALKLAEAYIELLNEEIKNSSNDEYTTKHHPIWKEIYRPIASIISNAQEADPELQYEGHVSLTAKVMASVYPWHWGKEAKDMNHIKAAKHIRAGLQNND